MKYLTFKDYQGRQNVAADESDAVYILWAAGNPIVSFGRYQKGSPKMVDEVLRSSPLNTDIREWGGLKAGEYYPRIWRPGGYSVERISQGVETISSSVTSFRVLEHELEEVFKNVHPVKDNFYAYGHKIRNILMLASMEVECALAGVLNANNYKSDRFTTNDYVKLKHAMLLNRYQVGFNKHPGLPKFTPFKGWDHNNPTKSLVWYDAYNHTKHNREEKFDLANLNNALNAFTAVLVLLWAQFGPFGGYDENDLYNKYTITFYPEIEMDKCYLPLKPHYEITNRNDANIHKIFYKF